MFVTVRKSNLGRRGAVMGYCDLLPAIMRSMDSTPIVLYPRKPTSLQFDINLLTGLIPLGLQISLLQIILCVKLVVTNVVDRLVVN